MKKRYVISIITVLLITLSFFTYNKYSNNEEIIDNKTIGIMLEDDYESDTYSLSDSSDIPIDQYIFNAEKTNQECSDATFSYDSTNNKVLVNTNKSIQCNMYFDIKPLVPSEYTQLQYLQSTGSQYINTLIPGNQGYKIIGTIKIDTISGEVLPFGVYSNKSGAGVNYVDFYPAGNTAYVIVRGGGNSITYKNVFYKTTKYDFEIGTFYDNNYFKLDGKSVDVNSIDTWGDSYTDEPMFLFGCNYLQFGYSGYITFYDTLAFYNASDEKVAEFVPAKCTNVSGCPNGTGGTVANNTLGMWDNIRGRMFTNAGSGTFIAGPEV